VTCSSAHWTAGSDCGPTNRPQDDDSTAPLDALRRAAIEACDRVREHDSQALPLAREAGARLNAVKKAMDRGQWMPWLRATFTKTTITAQLYMRIDHHWDVLEDDKARRGVYLSIREADRFLRRKKLTADDTEGSDCGPTNRPEEEYQKPRQWTVKLSLELKQRLVKRRSEFNNRSLDAIVAELLEAALRDRTRHEPT
jgi:hypothetical protein